MVDERNLCMKKVEEIHPIEECDNEIFVTCASFEERFLGVLEKLRDNFNENFVLFRFTEPNEKRERMLQKMGEFIRKGGQNKGYYQIEVEHGKSLNAVIKFHDFIQKRKNTLKEFSITVDISTFTKDLLANYINYVVNFLKPKKLRLFYTIPQHYASPEEGLLSTGVESIHIPPLSWNEWSPLKDNLLIIILGFEEMRAWSLIDKFCADSNWLFVTSPGSKPEWNSYCEKYNSRLLEEIPPRGKVPALDPYEVSRTFNKLITEDVTRSYNIFISPLGTKPQLIGVLHFIMTSRIPINILTTTVTEHNTPYYSRGVGDTFEFFFPLSFREKG
jgi:hypothetical protein